MAVSTHYLNFSTSGNADIIDITDDVSDALSKSGLSGGTTTIFAPGATGAVTTIEYESGLISDLKDMLERIAPQNIEYAHNLSGAMATGTPMYGQRCSVRVSLCRFPVAGCNSGRGSRSSSSISTTARETGS